MGILKIADSKPDITINRENGKTEITLSSGVWWMMFFLGVCLMGSGNDSHVNVSVDDKPVEVSEEDLHSKYEIAHELAHRDFVIKELLSRIHELMDNSSIDLISAKEIVQEASE